MASYRNNRAVTLIKIYLSSLAWYYTEYTQTLITLLWNAIIREKLCQLFSCGIVFLLIFAKMSISANFVFSPLQLIRHAANTSSLRCGGGRRGNLRCKKIYFNLAVKNQFEYKIPNSKNISDIYIILNTEKVPQSEKSDMLASWHVTMLARPECLLLTFLEEERRLRI